MTASLRAFKPSPLVSAFCMSSGPGRREAKKSALEVGEDEDRLAALEATLGPRLGGKSR
jgi:hypothetical protein